MKVGIVGPSYDQRSLPFDAQRAINLYPVFDKVGGKDVAALYGTPGLVEFANVGAGPIRGEFKSGNGRVFAVSGTGVYEVDSDGNGTLLGALFTSEGRVTMAEGTTQLAICDGKTLYSLTYATDSLAQVTDGDLPSSVGYVTNIDGYFVVSENNTGRFYISALNDVTSWDALDYATAENNPDSLVVPLSSGGQLWLFGERTTEIWTNTGASDFPFSPITGAVMQMGVTAPFSAVEVDNSIIWVGRDSHGGGIVYRANGFTPQRISTEPIERKLQAVSDDTSLCSWTYQEEGHVFYVLMGCDLETTLVYDLTTGLWHERAFLNEFGNFEQHLGSTHIYAFGKHLLGSRKDGKIYQMSLDIYDDDGEEIARERIYTHIVDEMKRKRYNSLEVGFETGVGLQSGQGSDPQVSLRLSKDGARTWSDEMTASYGGAGQYRTKVKFRRLGMAEQMTFKIRTTDPVKVAITGSYLF